MKTNKTKKMSSSSKRQRTDDAPFRPLLILISMDHGDGYEHYDYQEYAITFRDKHQFEAFSLLYDGLKERHDIDIALSDLLNPEAQKMFENWYPECPNEKDIGKELWSTGNFLITTENLHIYADIIGFSSLKCQFLEKTVHSFTKLGYRSLSEYDGKIYATRYISNRI